MFRFAYPLWLAGCGTSSFAPSGMVGPEAADVDTVGDTGGGDDTTTDTGTPPDPPDAVDLPSAYGWTGGTDYGDPLPIEVIAEAMETAVAAGPTYTPAPIFDAYSLAMLAARSDCPGPVDSGSVIFWIGACETPEGSVFDGYAQLTEYDDANFSGTTYFANATITTASGYRYVSAAHITDVQIGGVSDDRRQYDTFTGAVTGTNTWDGPGVSGTWMEEGLLPAMTLTFTVYEDGARDGTLTGVVAIPGDVFLAASYDATLWNEASGAACAEEPSGTVSLRDPDGNWYEARFDGGLEVEDASACDGCGTVYWRGQEVGEVCPDFSTWLSWGTRPW